MTRKRLILPLALSAALLAGCQSKIEYVEVRPTAPASYADCDAGPEPLPDDDSVTNEQAALAILALRRAIADCRETVHALWKIVQGSPSDPK